MFSSVSEVHREVKVIKQIVSSPDYLLQERGDQLLLINPPLPTEIFSGREKDLKQMEESFDFPIQCLAKKQRDLKDMKAELLAMKKYLRDVETWKESTQKILGELVRSGTVL